MKEIFAGFSSLICYLVDSIWCLLRLVSTIPEYQYIILMSITIRILFENKHQ